MIAQSLHLLRRLLAHILLEGEIAGHHVATKHEFLPNHQAELVADVVEVVALVDAAAPFAHHVHVGVAGRRQNLAIAFGCNAAGKAVEGNNVRALGEDGNSVHDERKALAPLVGQTAQLNRAQAGLYFGLCDQSLADLH